MIYKKGDELKSSARRGALATVSRYRIEGEYVTLAEIAARLSMTAKRASYRMQELRNASGAITWERLRS